MLNTTASTLNNLTLINQNSPSTIDHQIKLTSNNQTLADPLLVFNQGDVPLYLKVLASIFYMTSLVLGVGGNAFVLLIAFYYHRIRTVTNFFIINLAISDLIFVLLCIPSTYVTAYLLQYWPFSSVLCVFFNYMQTVSVTLTVYTLIWITLDKFWAILKPLKLRMSIKVCKYLIVGSWLFSLIISLPIALFTKLNYPSVVSSQSHISTTPIIMYEAYDAYYYNFNNNNASQADLNGSSYMVPSSTSFSMTTTMIINNESENLPQCNENWPDHLAEFAQVYNVLLLLIQYFVPLIILAFCYARIGIVLRKAKAPGESIQHRDAKMIQSKKKIVKMCFMMVLTFMIFWAPLHFLNVYRFYDEKIAYSKYFGDIFFVCHILAVSRSFVNPIIYAWTNSRFRDGLKYFLCCDCFHESKKHLSFSKSSELVRLRSSAKRDSSLMNTNRNSIYFDEKLLKSSNKTIRLSLKSSSRTYNNPVLF